MFRLTTLAALLLASTAATADQFSIKASATVASAADTLVLLVSPEQLNANPQLEAISKQENFKAAHGATLTWLAPSSPYSQYQRVVLLGTGDTVKLTPYQASLLGATAARTLKGSAASSIQLDASLISAPFSQSELLAQLSHGVDLASYTFTRYHSDKKPEAVRQLHLLSNAAKCSRAAFSAVGGTKRRRKTGARSHQ
ncbi:M17 family peptidase N-terminal domain-containing protein [Alishewanella longhuensis]